ncbi:SusC/RagA family TonB-linked outer membrane protein [Chitinophaga caeni]|uniref:SusC/RagA family TonB-linked outer membrane protein n=2 Tax=Chitinophaga caeni TaxID=2029983 RepID=A0A291QUZ7_9BACT|nr:SusC/RagA family TonB-linked outer membrane protein [Chitinophaga caeni]
MQLFANGQPMSRFTLGLGVPLRCTAKIWLIMKLVMCLLLGCSLHISAKSYGQQVSISAKGARLEAVFQEIKSQTGYTFVYNTEWLREAKLVDLQVQNIPMEQALQLTFKDQPFTYMILRKTVILKKREQLIKILPSEDNRQQLIFRGKVLDEKGTPIPGASIFVLGEKKGVVSGEDGRFNLKIDKLGVVVRISFIGYESLDYRVKNLDKPVTFHMRLKDADLNQVVVTGMVNLDKQTFSGAAAVYSQEQIKTITNTNIVDALKTLDPSFMVLENNIMGSNPNVLPNIELRGQTSITTDELRDDFSENPNQPLFILDGFPASLRQILDMDINRIASVTILKDAASTAMYGNRASNGVIVIQTVRPLPGKIRVSYTSDWGFEFPDLSSYNRMDASEKLEFERLSGRYLPNERFDMSTYKYELYDPLYSMRKQEVLRGVNSYWLSDPLQNGISQRHSLLVNGGADNLLFVAGISYKDEKGVMIGSGRKEWSGNLKLDYNTGKFRFNNYVSVNGNSEDESPYGSFSTWVNVNPYYRKQPASEMYLEKYRDGSNGAEKVVYNPLYNAKLNSYDRSKLYSLWDNLSAIYQVTDNLRFETNLQVRKDVKEAETFKSPLHTDFISTVPEEKGKYTNTRFTTSSFTYNALLSYNKSFGDHTLGVNLRSEISESKSIRQDYSAIGFPLTSNGNPSFAYNYPENGAPYARTSISRYNNVSFISTYSYRNIYNLNATFTYNGSSVYGINNPYSPFYSIAGSWNLHNAQWFKRDWIDNARLRVSYGMTGNQNFSSTSSVSTYTYLSDFNSFGQGVLLSRLGNPNLESQTTYQFNTGLDLNIFKNRLGLVVDYYDKLTDPLVVPVALPSSTALVSYPFNVGSLKVKGFEFMLNGTPIRTKDFSWRISVMGSKYKKTYAGLGNRLLGLNEKLKTSNSFVQYKDGYSENDIWAVRSLGIDPATGREIYLKKDGTQSFDYDINDQVVVGNTLPDIQGVVGSQFTYKNFLLNFSFRYVFGQDAFNTVLFNTIENLSKSYIINNNLDKRALYERWKEPGDLAMYKDIADATRTYRSSRFVQTENSFGLESANITYNLTRGSFLDKLSLSRLQISGRTSDIFRFTTVRRERGTSYPYSRAFQLSLTANFK